MNTSNLHNLSEPVSAYEEEIKQIREVMEEKYDVLLPKSEAAKLVQLTKELTLWSDADNAGPSKDMVEEVAEAVMSLGNQDLPNSQSYRDAHHLLEAVPIEQKQRLSKEITAILIEHRRIPYDPALLEKTAELLKQQYDVQVSEDKLIQAMQLIARTLWAHESLDSSLSRCLDDLLQKNENHAKVREALDRITEKLKADD